MKHAWLLITSTAIFFPACVEHPIGDPAGSNNYDDPDDPGNPGQNSSSPDASGDAYGRACQLPRDCPAAMVCAYSITEACAADGGICLPFDVEGCDAGYACGCDNAEVMLCAPPGYSPKAVQSSLACNAPPQDASVNDADVNDAGAGEASDQ